MVTNVKKNKLTIENILKVISDDSKAPGVIATKQLKTPKTQAKLRSAELLR